MHSYSIDSDARRTTYVILAMATALLPSAVAKINASLSAAFESSPNYAWPLGLGATFGLLFVVFDRVLWKLPPFRAVHRIPDLNGVWNARGLSSYLATADGSLVHEFSLTVKIRQTFTRIEVFTESRDSTSRSTMASICSDHAVPLVRYAFENVPKSKATPDLHRHPGLIELRVEASDKMAGDYFSGKHRLRYGELTMIRKTKT